MYLRFSQRANADGTLVRYVALAHNRRVDGKAKPDVLMNLGRVDRLDVDGLLRLAASIRKHLRRTLRTVPPLPSGVAVRDVGHLRTARRIPPWPAFGETARGTGRRGGGRWWDAANASRRGRAGRSGGRGAGRGHRSSPAW